MKKNLGLLLLCLVLALPALGQYVAQDPTRYVPNARVLGLGKAYIALANDTGALYTNPAGLTEALNWQFTSMSGKFLDEYSYLSFSGFYPTEIGVFGLGFAGTSIAGAWATTIESSSDPADPIFVIDPSQPPMGNTNNAVIVSFASDLNQYPVLKQVPLLERFSLGASAKIYQVRLYGDGIVGGDASGFDADLGLKFHAPQKWLTLGAAVQNFLPANLGGRLRYAAGHEESYPAVIEVGSAFNILGRDQSLLKFGDHDLKLMADADYKPSVSGYPIILHLGAEWKPISQLAIRAGIDQDVAGDGKGGLTVVSDAAYGVGFIMGGFRFDYAYHTFAGAPNVDNHFFSLSYGLIPPPRQVIEKVVIDEPADKTVTFANQVKVTGNVLDPDARRLRINDSFVRFGLKGEFDTLVPLKLGKNNLAIEPLDKMEKPMQKKNLRILRLFPYPDVPADYWSAQPISQLAMAGVVSGYPDGSFRPEGGISRAELCSMLMKANPPVSETASKAEFRDVPADHWANKFIAQAAARGVVKGYAGNLFMPNKKISRVEGLAMIGRLAGVSDEVYIDQFPDLPGEHWAAPLIAGAYQSGMLEFLKGKPFEPNRLLTRAEAVEILRQAGFVKELLQRDLLNWETY